MLQKPIFFVPFPQTTSQMFSCPLRCSVYVYYHVDYQNHLSENCIYRSEGKLGAVFWIFISMYFNIDLKKRRTIKVDLDYQSKNAAIRFHSNEISNYSVKS